MVFNLVVSFRFRDTFVLLKSQSLVIFVQFSVLSPSASRSAMNSFSAFLDRCREKTPIRFDVFETVLVRHFKRNVEVK